MPSAIDKVRPVRNVIGARIWDMGTEAPTANAAKIACNMPIAMAIEGMAEGLVRTETNGLDRFFDLIRRTLFGSRAYQVYSANIANRNYQPDFKATLGLKDLRLSTRGGRARWRRSANARCGTPPDGSDGGCRHGQSVRDGRFHDQRCEAPSG